MTTTLLRPDTLPDHRGSGSTHGSPVRRPAGPPPNVSSFASDTWVFFGAPHTDWTLVDRWGLGFGPAGTEPPRWSLFHCVSEDGFDDHCECPYPTPLDPVLLRWSASVVGRSTAAALLGSVGSCLDFYQQYFAERPDLAAGVGR